VIPPHRCSRQGAMQCRRIRGKETNRLLVSVCFPGYFIAEEMIYNCTKMGYKSEKLRPCRTKNLLAKTKDLPSRPMTQNFSSGTPQGQGPRPKTTALQNSEGPMAEHVSSKPRNSKKASIGRPRKCNKPRHTLFNHTHSHTGM